MFTIKNRNHIKTITIINKRYEHIHNEYFEIILKNVPPRWCLLIYIYITPSISFYSTHHIYDASFAATLNNDRS